MFKGRLMSINSYMSYHFLPPGLDLESLHVTSEKDEFYPFSNEFRAFDNPEVILHE